MPQSGDRITPEHFERERNHHAMELLQGIYQSYGALVTRYISVEKKSGQLDKATVEALVDGQTNILEFLRSAPRVTNVIPRTPRPGVDRVRFAQGQHAGVSLQIVSETTGLVTRINFYGALRDPSHHLDEHDSRGAYGRIHSDRSLETASETAHIDLHMIGLSTTEPFLDLWLSMNLQSLRLSSYIFEGTRSDVLPSISNRERAFKELYSPLNTAMKNLAMMVPNPYSPR